MNARQKAKKYKRMYEELLNKPVQFKIEQHKIDTLRVERLYPEQVILEKNNSYIPDLIVNDIAISLASKLSKYVNYKTERWPLKNMYHIIGEIKVVEARRNE